MGQNQPEVVDTLGRGLCVTPGREDRKMQASNEPFVEKYLLNIPGFSEK